MIVGHGEIMVFTVLLSLSPMIMCQLLLEKNQLKVANFQVAIIYSHKVTTCIKRVKILGKYFLF